MEQTLVYSPKTLTEVYTVLNALDLLSKIPREIVDFLKKNKDNSYKFYFFEEYPLEIQIENVETNEFLSYLYLKYICDSEEEKQLLKKEFVKNDVKEETLKKEKYNPENLFNNNSSISNSSSNSNGVSSTNIEEAIIQEKEELEIIPKEEESIFRKIINKIIHFFTK